MDRVPRLPVHVQDKRPAYDWTAHHTDVAPRGDDVILRTAAEVREWRANNARLLARHTERRKTIKKQDRRNGLLLVGFGGVFALVLLTALIWVGWIAWQFLSTLGLGALAFPILILAAFASVVGGHRCITVVQHWH